MSKFLIDLVNAPARTAGFDVDDCFPPIHDIQAERLSSTHCGHKLGFGEEPLRRLRPHGRRAG